MVSGKDAFLKFLYDEIAPTLIGVDYVQCKMYKMKSDTVRVALKILAEKELYEFKIAKERRKSAMFNAATAQLTEQELDVILIRYQGERDRTDLTASEFEIILSAAEKKLTNLIKND
ncbi:hypothetical protein [Metabacillus idriensis]|uniref:hypothetical protein n=1 Tax=Metabacillus idriensis TaxID=324768 RepID=UPI001CD42853|nr:hypothetical protein [Metabacillus idriensis]